ncbi:MAG: hypothetical protein M1828_004949 [Chrysothrix sp. TS-e1954]|nr:MAG: hypothetical protein M1828_004949 [Chrysothrix sp. TS-e1954]
MDGLSLNGEGPTDLAMQLDSFRRSDEQRDALMKTLLNRCHEYVRQLQSIKNDHDNEKWSRTQWQSRARVAEQKLDSNPFALALIDGDGAIFQEQLLKSGPMGGSEAAHQLHNEIKNVLQERIPEIGGMPIMVQIYANVEDLSRKLAEVGILPEPAQFNDFASAFSLNQPLFNIIDVGRGKERADHKIREMFRLFASNVHCKQIIFGGCHDNGYLNDLEPIKRNKDIADKMTLLETTPAQWQFKSLGFPIVRFSSVFRDNDLPSRYGAMQHQAYKQPAHNPPQMAATSPMPVPPPAMGSPINPNANVFNTQLRPTPSPAQSSSNVFAATPPSTNGAASPASQAPSLSRAPASHTNGPAPQTTAGSLPPSAPNTWATISKTSPTNTSRSISIVPASKLAQSQPVPPRRSVIHNAYGERLDTKLVKPDHEAQQAVRSRIAAQKMCNHYHLRGSCKNPGTCTYQHGERLSAKERVVLMGKTRTTPCTKASDCMDPECYLAHVCPSGDSCSWEDCWHQHLEDTVPYKKIYDDGDIEYVAA